MIRKKLIHVAAASVVVLTPVMYAAPDPYAPMVTMSVTLPDGKTQTLEARESETASLKLANGTEIRRFISATGLPYQVENDLTSEQILAARFKGPVGFGHKYDYWPEWTGFVYHAGGKTYTSDCRPNGCAKVNGRTQLAGFDGAHFGAQTPFSRLGSRGWTATFWASRAGRQDTRGSRALFEPLDRRPLPDARASIRACGQGEEAESQPPKRCRVANTRRDRPE